MTIAPILANPQFTTFTKRYAWNDTVHKVVWKGAVHKMVRKNTVLRAIEMTLFVKSTYKVRGGSFPWRTSRLPGPHRIGWKTSQRYTSTTPTVVSSG